MNWYIASAVVSFMKATSRDAEKLARASKSAFENDIHYGAPIHGGKAGGPPGYQSPEWQRRMMRTGWYYKILVDNQIVGGFIVFPGAIREYYLGRVFIHSDFRTRVSARRLRISCLGNSRWRRAGQLTLRPGINVHVISMRNWDSKNMIPGMTVRQAGIQSSTRESSALPPEHTAQQRLGIFRIGCQRDISSFAAEPCHICSVASSDSTVGAYAYQAIVQIEQVGQHLLVLLPLV